MNNDIDYPVAPAFGESNARYDQRRLKVKSLIFKENELRHNMGIAKIEIEMLSETIDALERLFDFLQEVGGSLTNEGHCLHACDALKERRLYLNGQCAKAQQAIERIMAQKKSLGA